MKWLLRKLRKPITARRLTDTEAQNIIDQELTPKEAYEAYPHAPHAAYDVANGKTRSHLR